MNFINPQQKIDKNTISGIESELNISLPQELKDQYLSSNGGRPSLYVYEDENIDTVVSDFLPISSSSGERTAADIYKHLVIQKQLVPYQYFPFAIDGGGDYFFVDCLSTNGSVYFYRSESSADEERLVPLGMGIKEFWSSLKPE